MKPNSASTTHVFLPLGLAGAIPTRMFHREACDGRLSVPQRNITGVKIMDESRFKSLMLHARMLDSEYGTGYQRGLRRHYHGDKFGTPEEHAALLQVQADKSRQELGRGYRDGFAGKEPEST